MAGPIIRPKVVTELSKFDYGKKLQATLGESRGSYVNVGILEPNRKYPESQATLGQVAAWHEFGTHTKDGLPLVASRSFIRTPTDKAVDKIAALKTRQLDEIVMGKATIRQALGRMGADLQRRMQNAIVEGIAPPLAPSTLAEKRRKGQPDTPLIATGFLKSAIGFAVFIKGERVTPFKPPHSDLSATADKLNAKAKERAKTVAERRAIRRANKKEADAIRADHAKTKRDFKRANKAMAERKRRVAKAEVQAKRKADKRAAKRVKREEKRARKAVRMEAKQQRRDFSRARAAHARRQRQDAKQQRQRHVARERRQKKAERKAEKRIARAEKKQMRRDFRRARKSFNKRSSARQKRRNQ